jgi:hypothetical protein
MTADIRAVSFGTFLSLVLTLFSPVDAQYDYVQIPAVRSRWDLNARFDSTPHSHQLSAIIITERDPTKCHQTSLRKVDS